MTVATPLGNMVLVLAPVALIWHLAPAQQLGLRRGATAAGFVLVGFLAVRAAATLLGRPLPVGGDLELLIFISVTEELAKYLAVRLPVGGANTTHRGDGRYPHTGGVRGALPGAIATGIGFAAFENLAYLTVPTTTFLLRIALVGALHVGTTALYGWTRRRSLTVAYVALGGGIALHTAFNYLVRHLTIL